MTGKCFSRLYCSAGASDILYSLFFYKCYAPIGGNLLYFFAFFGCFATKVLPLQGKRRITPLEQVLSFIRYYFYKGLAPTGAIFFYLLAFFYYKGFALIGQSGCCSIGATPFVENIPLIHRFSCSIGVIPL